MTFSKNRIGVPFGNSNAQIDLPISAQPDGSESRETGYTSAHETKVSLGGKPLQRSILNQILKETQGAIKDIQNTGAPPWFSQADNNGFLMNYPIGARVRHSSAEWISNINNNNSEPGAVGASWILVSQAIFNGDIVVNASRTLTSADVGKLFTCGDNPGNVITLPLASTIRAGDGFIFSGGFNKTTISTSGSDLFRPYDKSSLFLIGNQSFIATSNEIGSWRLIATTQDFKREITSTYWCEKKWDPALGIYDIEQGGEISLLVGQQTFTYTLPNPFTDGNFLDISVTDVEWNNRLNVRSYGVSKTSLSQFTVVITGNLTDITNSFYWRAKGTSTS